MYNSLNDEMKTIADRYIDMFKNTNEREMRNEIQNMLYSIKDAGGLEVDDKMVYGLNDEERLNLFVAIYENILDEETKIMFINEILENSSLINSSINPKIVDYFEEKAQEFGEQDLNESDSPESETEEPVEEEDKEIDSKDFSDTEIPETEEENKEEEKELEEESKEGPEITKYKEETEELRQLIAAKEQELEALLNSMNSEVPESPEVPENNELDELIAQTTLSTKEEDNEELKNIDELIERLNRDKGIYERQKENFVEENPNYESFVDLKKTYELLEKAIARIDGEIKKAEQDREIIINKPKENNNKTVLVEVRKFRELYQKEIDKLENQLKTLNDLQDKYYKENKGIPLENLIEKMKKDFHEVCGIRFDININAPENQVLIENVLVARELEEKNKEQINEKFKDELPEKEQENNTPENNETIENLKAEIEGMKTELGERDKNIETYYSALEDINKISNEKDKESEIVKLLTESAKEKINSITNENLRNELNKYLEKALAIEIETVKKDRKKWHKWIAGIAGALVGGLTVAFAPGAALGIIIGTQVAKKAVNMYHSHLKKKEAELGKENEITGIEKPNEKQKSIASKFKEFMKNEDNIKNINWFLNGATIGAATVGLVNAMTPNAPIQNTTPPGPTPNPTPTDPYSQIKIGDSASGLDLSQGYDQANWAANNINSEALNQAIMQDGNSVINSVGVVQNGGTQIVNTAGKSLAEIAQQYGVSPEELVMNIGNQQGAPRAWVDAAEAVGRTL